MTKKKTFCRASCCWSQAVDVYALRRGDKVEMQHATHPCMADSTCTSCRTCDGWVSGAPVAGNNRRSMRSISLVAAGATNIPGQAINDTTRVHLLPARMEVGFLAAIQEMVGVNYLPAILPLAVESKVDKSPLIDGNTPAGTDSARSLPTNTAHLSRLPTRIVVPASKSPGTPRTSSRRRYSRHGSGGKYGAPAVADPTWGRGAKHPVRPIGL